MLSARRNTFSFLRAFIAATAADSDVYLSFPAHMRSNFSGSARGSSTDLSMIPVVLEFAVELVLDAV